jgi:hypothetical protein
MQPKPETHRSAIARAKERGDRKAAIIGIFSLAIETSRMFA